MEAQLLPLTLALCLVDAGPRLPALPRVGSVEQCDQGSQSSLWDHEPGCVTHGLPPSWPLSDWRTGTCEGFEIGPCCVRAGELVCSLEPPFQSLHFHFPFLG